MHMLGSAHRLVLAVTMISAFAGAGTAQAQALGPGGEFAAAGNRLGFALYRQIAAQPGNIVMSPYSIATAMAMALAGAHGETEKEMAAALHMELPANELADAYTRLDRMLNQDSTADASLVRTANALHLTRHGNLVAPAFRQFIAERYGAQIFQGSDLAAVNGWVQQRTNGRIAKILSRLDPNSVGVLLNAIYFKGAWSEQFNRSATHSDAFRLATGEVVQTSTMREQGFFHVVRAPGYDAIRMPYRKSGLGMIVVLPTRANGIGEVEAGLDSQSAATILAGLAAAPRQKVELSLPRFRLELAADLIAPLRGLGMTLAFDRDRADFGGITGSDQEADRLHISQIQHRAFIDVNEDGTEAAAATAVEFAKRSAPVPAMPFKIDRPFLYLVADEASGAILFIGRVMDPRTVEKRQE
jgi:serpin B